ncbi:Glyoxylase, beta-lactamase superfamily II [Ectothiorhodosinus mongolicus]|uniref:Glyoxylase, beta-lactamase superfamily II n=1 Tax=Ectothiorhodosinus mongolicus TaxID=233100 RepID=A0A1R3VMV6_9GAMM|nr:MBL fold metallo-hydrolase [Ectothiorhodosinus mongolicus]ULX56399.1 Zn-dependent hydrolase [Ectothiorhodosinus mongolicus]SIT65920.1 Glyoxylase, beta-lactamase superfamily II [Ectothiorhodosinus mongolicus]
MLFRQLYEPDSSTFTYLLSCPDTGVTALIDPVLETVERDLEVLQSMGLKLDYAIETHIHADHITGAKKLKNATGCQIAGPAQDELPCRDIGLTEGAAFQIGGITLNPLFTPGHTDTHHAYLLDHHGMPMLFSGDALLIEACGRTDFQSGDAHVLYRSIHNKFFRLPDETLVYPAHDYEDRRITTIGQEKLRNPRLGKNRSEEEFVAIMNGLDLPYPRKIDFSVPGNELCGMCPDNMPEEMKGLCKDSQQR